MLNPIRKSVGLALVILGLSLNLSSQAFAVGGDRGPGNGGDGLEMSAVKGQGTVIVPPPGGIGTRGILRVEGKLGIDQEKKSSIFDLYEANVYLQRCAQDANGKAAKLGCGDIQKIPLNESISLTPGLYKIRGPQSTTLSSGDYGYETTSMPITGAFIFVKIETGKTTTLPFSIIRIPRGDRSFSYSIDVDYTSPRMQQAIADDFFSDSVLGVKIDASNVNCKKELDQNTLSACLAWQNATSSQELIGKSILFSKYQTPKVWSKLNFYNHCSVYRDECVYFDAWAAKIDWWQGSYTEHLVQGDSTPNQEIAVAVFPGVYMITFRDNQSGEVQTQTGVVVE